MRKIAIVIGLVLACGLGASVPSYAYVGSGYVVPACTGNAATDTATLKTAFAKGGLLILPSCEYVVNSTLRLQKGTHLIGAGSSSTIIRSVITDGTPLIDTDPYLYTSGVRIADIGFVGPYGQGQVGTGDAFLLYAATNISTFARLRIANFRGNAFTIKRQKKNTGDPTTLLNADFDSIKVENVGGYAFDIEARVHATWNDITIDSPATGGFRFRKGYAEESFIHVTDLVANWQQSWSSKNHVVVFDIANYNVINFENCVVSVSSAVDATNLTFIRTNSTLNPNLIGCTAVGKPFKYWVADTKNPQNNKPYTSSITFRF